MSYTRNNKAVKGLLGLGSLALMVSGSLATAGTITGSAHDFKDSGFTGGQICVTCHVPHNGAAADQGPLWNHEMSTANYTLYGVGSTTFDADDVGSYGQPTGASKLCLSCHDGTVAIDSFGGTTGGTLIGSAAGGSAGADGVANGGTRDLGTNLSNDHPFSFNYALVADADGGIFQESKTGVQIGDTGGKNKSGTLQDMLLGGGTDMQCTSCHDVHNEYTATTNGTAGYRLLKISLNGSSLCLTCHDK